MPDTLPSRRFAAKPEFARRLQFPAPMWPTYLGLFLCQIDSAMGRFIGGSDFFFEN